MRKLICALLLLYCGLVLGQAPGTGNYAFSTFDSRGFDSVNLGNLNVRFTIPIVSRTGRGLPFNYALQYEGLVWSQSSATGTATWVPDPAWGFSGLLNGTGMAGYLTHRISSVACPRPPNVSHNPPPTQQLNNFTYHDEFGASHAFNYSITFACPYGNVDDTSTGDGKAKDNSGYSLNVNDTSEVLTRSGRVITPAQSATGQDALSLVDSNGNQITGSGSGNFTDTLGVNALTISGSNPRAFTYPVTRQSNSATTANATLSYQTSTVRTNFGCPNIVEYGATSVSLPYRLTLADGSFYQFAYEATPNIAGAVTGRIASVTLPTGGVVSYQYRDGCNGSGLNADGTLGGLNRTTSDGTRQYTRVPINGNATRTTLTDEKGDQTVYSFSIDSGTWRFLETHRQVYQGTTSGTQLEDQYTCYNGAAANCDGGTVTLPITEADVTVSFNGGNQSLTKNTYDSNGTLLTDSKQMNGTALITELQQSFNTLGELTASTKRDGPSGNAYAFAYYNYDEGSPTVTSGVPQHTAATGTRGNLTSAHVSAGAVYLNTSTTFYDTGQPWKSTAQDGGVTTFGYDSTQGFVTSTSLPTPSSGVALSTSAQYDSNSTAPLSFTGMNGDTSTITQYDARMRSVTATLPSGSTVNFTYDTPVHTWITQTLDSSRTASAERLLDGFGRLSRTTQYNGQASNQWYQTDYCYDSTGLLQFQSAAYQSTGLTDGHGNANPKHCSGAGVTYAYDALGRTTSVTTNDGSKNEITTTTYNNRAVKVTDPNNVSRITQYDSVGRVSAVCEVASNSYGGQAPSSCGTDIAGTGFLTTYSYTLDGSAYPTTTVIQGSQLRVFKTDNAGRPLSTTEPERGATNYSYSFNSIGLQASRTRPQANQTNASTLTTTTTQYDLLGRVVSVTYNDGVTPNKSFFYDTAQPGSGWSSSPANVKGRLAAVAAANNTRAQFSYDLAGNVLSVLQCAPSICGGANQQSRPPLQYTYDYSGALLSAFDGASGMLAYTRSAAGEVTSVTNQSYSGGANPANLVSNVVNGPQGPTSWALGNGLNGVKSYDPLGRVTGSFACAGSSSTFCSGGSFQAYGNSLAWNGARMTNQCDTSVNYCSNNSYDEFNRLTGVQSGSSNLYIYGYDRYGNRVNANGTGYSFNAATNQQTNNGYDAAGNQLTDASHSYQYDAEGKILQVDAGTTAKYVYDALEHRVRATTSSSDLEYLFDPFGRRQSSWIVSANFGNEGREYWDYGLLANRSQNGGTYFHHTNYLGTERARTDWTGARTSSYTSGPFGEGQSDGIGIDTNQDSNGYTSQDHDPETGTDHFQYRQYSEYSGRWLSPDPSSNTYHYGSPQSLNRYVYASNNPLVYIDPDGLSDDATTSPYPTWWGSHNGSGSLVDAFKASLGAALDGTPVDAGAYLDSPGYSPFEYKLSGTLFGKPVSETFQTFDDYADWRTGQAAQLENQAYSAFALACQHTTTPCSGDTTVTTRYQGYTPNFALQSHSVDTSSMAGLFSDPLTFAHAGKPSWYEWAQIETGHISSYGNDIEVHFDAFGPFNPLHSIVEFLPSLLINPSPGHPGPTFSCALQGGCSWVF